MGRQKSRILVRNRCTSWRRSCTWRPPRPWERFRLDAPMPPPPLSSLTCRSNGHASSTLSARFVDVGRISCLCHSTFPIFFLLFFFSFFFLYTRILPLLYARHWFFFIPRSPSPLNVEFQPNLLRGGGHLLSLAPWETLSRRGLFSLFFSALSFFLSSFCLRRREEETVPRGFWQRVGFDVCFSIFFLFFKVSRRNYLFRKFVFFLFPVITKHWQF